MRDPLQTFSEYFDESLPPDEVAKLAAWIVADPGHGREFVRASFLHSRLRDVLRQEDVCGLVFDDADANQPWVDSEELIRLLDEQALLAERQQLAHAQQEAARLRAAEEAAKREPLRHPGGSPYSKPTFYVALAAAAVLLAVLSQLTAPRNKVVLQRPSREGATLPAPRVEAPPPPPIATVTQGRAAAGGPAGARAAGARLAAGRLTLTAGAAEFRLDSGARLVLEAPAVVELATADRARLEGGRIVARVPRKAIGFTLQARGATFVDLGTEFGVDVDAAGAADVHVFQGEVALVRGADAETNVSTTLSTGAAAHVSSDGGDVAPIKYAGQRFLRRVPKTPYELAVWKSKPLVWWRMNEPADAIDLASSGAAAAIGVVRTGVSHSPEFPAGGPGPAAAFAPGHEGVLIDEPNLFGMTRAFSLEAWAFNSGGPATSHRILSNFERQPRRGFAFGVVDGAWFERDSPQRALIVTLHGVYDCISVTEAPLNQWMHVVATIDDAGCPKLYLNGQPVETMLRRVGRSEWVSTEAAAKSWEGVASRGPLTLGRNPARPVEEWQGSLSHVAVYDRVLTSDEIRVHFDAAAAK